MCKTPAVSSLNPLMMLTCGFLEFIVHCAYFQRVYNQYNTNKLGDKNILTSFCCSLCNFDTVTSAVIFTPLKKSVSFTLIPRCLHRVCNCRNTWLEHMFSFSTALLLTRKMQLQPLRAVHLRACIHTTTRGQDRSFTACLALLVVSWMWGASPQGTAAVSAVRSHSISWFMSIHLSSAPGSFQMTRFMFFSYYGWAEIDDSSGPQRGLSFSWGTSEHLVPDKESTGSSLTADWFSQESSLTHREGSFGYLWALTGAALVPVSKSTPG